MTPADKSLSPLLRGVEIEPLPHMLARPHRVQAVAPVQAAVKKHESAHVLDGLPSAAPDAAPPAAVTLLPDAVYEQARAKGLEEGRAAGLQLGLKDARERIDEATRTAQAAAGADLERATSRLTQQWTDRLAKLDAVTCAFEDRLASHWTALEADAVVLAFETVCRLLANAAGQRETVEALVAQAMCGLRSQPMRVRLNAADLALLDHADANGGTGLRARHPGIEWVADAAVRVGGCLIDSAAGTLDARLDTQLQRLLQNWRTASAEVSR